VLFLIIASGLRFYKLDQKSLWYDELHSIIPTNPENSFSSVIEYSYGDQPPLFFVMLYAWFKVFPYDEASGKAFCAILGILGVVAMYFLGKEVADEKVGLAAMFVTACNMFHIYYSQELRFYSLLFLMTVVSFLTFIRLVKEPSLKNQILFVIASTGLLYTHYFGMVVGLSQALIYLLIGLLYKKDKPFFLKGMASGFVILLAFTPWLPIILKDNSISSFWIQDPGPLFFLEYFSRYFNGWWALSFKYILNVLLLGVILLYLWNITTSREPRAKNSNLHNVVIFGWFFLTLIIPYVYTVLKIPMLVDRYTLITLPAVLLMIALGWRSIPNKYLKIFLVAVFVVCLVRVYHRYYNKFKKPEYRELSLEIIQQNTHAYPVLSREAWHLNYFFRKYHAGYEVQPIDSLHPSWLNGKEKFWVVIPQLHLNENQRALIRSGFEIEKELVFYGGMQAELYRRAIR
jgi:uncharacterized membrane protein